MSTETTVPVLLPSLGESVTEATIVEWLKQPGDPIELDEEIVEVTSDKADLRIPSPAAGVLARIVAQPGETIEIGDILCELSENGSAPSANGGGTAPVAAPPPAAAEIADITLPSLGESVTEATIVEWIKGVGDSVALDEEIVEITSDKADLRVPSPFAGALTEIVAQPGDTIEVGGLLARIAVGAAGQAAPTTPAAPSTPAPSTDGPVRATGGGLASPLARRLAGEQGVDIASVTGSGKRGRVEAADIAAAANGAGAAPPGEERVQLRGPAAALAGYMDESRSIPTATTFRTLPVGTLDARRRHINEALAAAGRSEKLSFTHLVAWAIVKAVERFPAMATGFEAVDGKPHKLVRHQVNIGLAVDVERRDGSRSLLVPVVRAAEQLRFDGFLAAYDDLVKRTRSGNVKPDELRGASVTLTNPGGFGTVASVPRLMPGQGTIVATGSIALPVGFEHVDARALGIQKVMTATSTYDHRVIQGAESGAFLRQIDLFLAGEDGFYDEVAASLGVALPPLEPPAPAPATVVAPPPSPGPADYRALQAMSTAMALVKAHRIYGHLAADLDPLGYPPVGDPALEPASVELTPDMMALVPAELLRAYIPGRRSRTLYPRMRETYCGTIAYEVEHITSHEQAALAAPRDREWVHPGRHAAGRTRQAARAAHQRRRIRALPPAGVHRPEDVLDRGCRRARADARRDNRALRGVRRQPDRHRNGPPGPPQRDHPRRGPAGGIDPGRVRGHDRARRPRRLDPDRGRREVPPRRRGHLHHPLRSPRRDHPRREPEPPGAGQRRRRGRHPRAPDDPRRPRRHGRPEPRGAGARARRRGLPQVRASSPRRSTSTALAGFSTGGTIHIIANNQIGFTTDPQDSRSTRHASDLAKGFDIPIIHVNGDDVDACISAVRLAVAYRNKFKRDILIDLIGYRRLGHNEVDEPAYTQPVMTRTIKNHPRP